MDEPNILGYDNYLVTPEGAIFNVKTWRELKLHLCAGYPSVKLYRDGVPDRVTVHRLVALAYLPRVEGKDYVNHKDGDRTNNHYSNLEWVTHQENCQHRASVLLKGVGERARSSKLTASKVELIRKLYERGSSMKELSSKFGIAVQNIHQVITRQSWKHVV